MCFRDDNRQEERHTVRLWRGQVVPSRGVLPQLPQGGLQSPVPTVRVSSTEPRKKKPVVCMYMCICSYLPILNAFTQINIPIPPSPNTNSSIFVACYLFQDHILCTNFLFPLYISYPSLLKYRPPSHSNQRDNPLFLHANFSQIDITFPQQFKQSINLSMYM